jgi:GNAT superfamily N-acetyltransferase
MEQIILSSGYQPGAIGRVAQLHGTYYHAHWGFGLFFEAQVAIGLSEFLTRFDPSRDGFWTVAWQGCIEGAIAIQGPVEEKQGAHLRWFIISEVLQGRGAGNRLIDAAMEFCRKRRFPSISLWTFEGLEAARHLYSKHGFKPVEENTGTRWGAQVNEQRFECTLFS